MHCKMPPGQKIPETAEYLCEKCEHMFFFEGLERLRCPNCYTTNTNWLVAVYVEENALEEDMVPLEEYGQGD